MIITNVYNLPQPLVDAASAEHAYTPKRYSVTTLLKGTCEAILLRRHADEITMDVSDMVWLLFGTAVHSVLEQSLVPHRVLLGLLVQAQTELRRAYDAKDWDGVAKVLADVEALTAKVNASPYLQEEYLSMPFGEYTMSGIFDFYNDETKTVTDWKTASVWKPIYNDWADYRKQLMAYCLLLRHAGFDASNGEIVALLKDHSQTDAERKADYPQHPVYQIGWHFTDAELEATREQIALKFARIADQEGKPDEELTPCQPEERWQKPPKFAVMKGQNKRAVKLFDTAEEAQDAADALNLSDVKAKAGYWVQARPGECTKCKRYCMAREFCKFYRETVAPEGGEE